MQNPTTYTKQQIQDCLDNNWTLQPLTAEERDWVFQNLDNDYPDGITHTGDIESAILELIYES